MQTRFLQTMNTLNEYRTVIFAVLILTILIALFVMPSAFAEAGRAISNGG